MLGEGDLDLDPRRLVEPVYLVLVAGFTVWVRLRPWEDVFTPDGVVFIGTDAWYHYRHAVYTAANFPRTLRFDLFTRYPTGTATGQYGSLFDALAAAGGLMLGGGEAAVATAAALLPPVLAGATVVAVYLLARRAWGVVPAGFAALVLALLPGLWMFRGLVGGFDHHIGEAFFSTAFLAALFWALARGEGLDVTLWDVAEDPTVLRSVLPAWAGAATALVAYVLVWAPGVLFVAVASVGLGAAMLRDHLAGETTRDVQWTGFAVLGGAGVLMVAFVRNPGLTAVAFSWLQPLFTLAAGLGIFLAGEALAWSRKAELPRWAVPAALALGVPGAVLAAGELVPALGATLDRGMVWVFGVGDRGGLSTISEAQPSSLAILNSEYGLLLLTAFLGVLPVLVWAVRDGDRRMWVVLVWTVVGFSAAFSQVRFNYYLAVVVATLNGALMAAVTRLVGLTDPFEDGVAWHQAVAVMLVVLVVLPGNVLGTRSYQPAWDRAETTAPGEVVRWRPALDWMRENTPPEPFTLTDTFPPDGTLPPDAYGVLAWWDYGHWITAVARRIPVANPFQQSAPLAARWLTNTSEAGADQLLERRQGTVRYVVLDDATATGKYQAVTFWADVGYDERRRPIRFPDGRLFELPVPGARYNRSMTNRLYAHDANGLEHHRLVHETEQVSLIGSIADVGEQRVTRFNRVVQRMSASDARDRFGEADWTSGDMAVQQSGDRWLYDAHVESTIKVFERVAGARLRGSADPGAEVEARLTLESGTTDRRFTYVMRTVAGDDGSFSMRVPYATSEPVPVADGGTRYSVRAEGLYEVASSTGATAVAVVPDRTVRTGGEVVVNLT